MIQTRLIDGLVWLNRRSFIWAVRQTLIAIFPLALVGSLACLVEKSLLNVNGFFYNILVVGNWLPQAWQRPLQFVFTSIVQVIFSLIGLVACYFSAVNTARWYRRDSSSAGLTAVITLLLIAYRYGKTPQMPLNFRIGLLGGKNLLFGLLIGYGVGQLYRWLETTQIGQGARARSFASLRPLVVAIICGAIIAMVINSGTFYRVYARSYANLVTASQGPQNVGISLLLSLGVALMDWLGLGMPTSYGVPLNTPAYAANLNYALAHGSSWNVPYKFLGSTLYNSFANFGGDGLVLALIVAILLFPGNTGTHRVARWSALPTIFNFDYGSLVGLPIILNPVFLLPFMLLPVINMSLAAGMIALHLLPSTPYPVLLGTPGPLLGFIATNGNWSTLLFTIVLLLIDILAYIPFVRLSFLIEAKSTLKIGEGDHHA